MSSFSVFILINFKESFTQYQTYSFISKCVSYTFRISLAIQFMLVILPILSLISSVASTIISIYYFSLSLLLLTLCRSRKIFVVKNWREIRCDSVSGIRSDVLSLISPLYPLAATTCRRNKIRIARAILRCHWQLFLLFVSRYYARQESSVISRVRRDSVRRLLFDIHDRYTDRGTERKTRLTVSSSLSAGKAASPNTLLNSEPSDKRQKTNESSEHL